LQSSNERGKKFELLVAAMVRRKADSAAKRDSRSGANWHRRSDIFTNLPLHIEAKDHETLKPKEWFREASSAASFNQTPVVVFHSDEEVMAMLRFDDLLNLFVEIADLKAEVEDLSKPITPEAAIDQAIAVHRAAKAAFPKTAEEVKEQVEQLPPRRTLVCKEGHIADEYKAKKEPEMRCMGLRAATNTGLYHRGPRPAIEKGMQIQPRL
jgi:hypothetical protein